MTVATIVVALAAGAATSSPATDVLFSILVLLSGLLVVAVSISSTAASGGTATSTTTIVATATSATTSVATTVSLVTLATTVVLVTVAVCAPATGTSTSAVVFGKIREFRAPFNFEFEALTFLGVQVFKDVHEAVILVFINIKQSALACFDTLDNADVVSDATSPPVVQKGSASCNSQLTSVLDRSHDQSKLLLLTCK